MALNGNHPSIIWKLRWTDWKRCLFCCAAVEVGTLFGRAAGSRSFDDRQPQIPRTLRAVLNKALSLRQPAPRADRRGPAYVAACRQFSRMSRRPKRIAAGEYTAPKGSLFITAPVVFGRLHVLPVITEFLAAYPDVDIRLRLGDRLVNLVEDRSIWPCASANFPIVALSRSALV